MKMYIKCFTKIFVNNIIIEFKLYVKQNGRANLAPQTCIKIILGWYGSKMWISDFNFNFNSKMH